MQLNIQSLKSKLDILEVESQSSDVVIFTETWLSDKIPNPEILISNFQSPFRCDSQNRIEGGIAIYVKKGLQVLQCPVLTINGLEVLCVELHFNNRKCLVGGIYRQPDANNYYWQLTEESIDQAFSGNIYDIVISAEFKINMMSSDSNKLSNCIL